MPYELGRMHLGAEALSHQVKRGVTPIAKPQRREKSPSRLARKTRLRPSTSSTLKVTPLGHCTDEQKARVRDFACLACGGFLGLCDPAHLIDRGVVSVEAADDVRAVVPLCRHCHDLYDELKLDLSALLEPRWRDAVAWAVEAVGLFRALRRITGLRWAPVEPETPLTEGDLS